MPRAEVRSGQNSLFNCTFEALPREGDNISVFGGGVAGPDKTVLFTVAGVLHEVCESGDPADEYGSAEAVVFVNTSEDQDDFVSWDQREENRVKWKEIEDGRWRAEVDCTRIPRHGHAALVVDRIGIQTFRWAVAPTHDQDREELRDETFFARGTSRSLKAAQMAAAEAERCT